MTQTMFAPPPVLEPVQEEVESGGSRRTLLVAGGLVAALALGGGGYVLLSGGSSETPSAAPVIRFGHKPATTKVTTPAKVKPAVKVPATSTVPLGRDPFHALYILPVQAAPTTDTPATSTAPASTSSSTTTTSTTTAAKPTVYKLVLSSVSGSGTDRTATFSVGGKFMVAKVGSVFGPTSELKLLDLTQTSKGWVATLQVGDGEPFDAKKGETLYVR